MDIFIFPKCKAIIAGKPKLNDRDSSKSKFSPPYAQRKDKGLPQFSSFICYNSFIY